MTTLAPAPARLTNPSKLAQPIEFEPISPYRARLTPVDCALLLLVCLALYGYHLIHHQVLSTHEAVHCENVREMFRTQDWIIPTYGGRPWLERPPLPHWITGAAASLVGSVDEEWALRVGSILAGMVTVFLTARMAARWYGRSIGVLSGAILATMREFVAYATGPEADIFLCALVTLAHVLVVHVEFYERPREAVSRFRFLGKRSATLWILFIVLGLTNLAKGPFFGLFFVLGPLAVWFAWNRDVAGVRRYMWLWGLLAGAAAGGAWYAAALWRYPDMVDLWRLTFSARVDTDSFGEPAWYYLVNQIWSVVPWALPVLAGLALTARRAWSDRTSAERYLWCWAWVPLLVLSLPRGKHHHYLLHTLPPLAVLGAVGAVRLWGWLREQPAWLRKPWLVTLVCGVAGDAGLIAFGSRLPGPDWFHLVLLAAWPVLVFLCWGAAGARNGRWAASGMVAVMVLCMGAVHAVQAAFMDSYAADSAFVLEAEAFTPADQPVLVLNDFHPLNASWFLFYLHGRGRLVHKVSFLRADDLPAPTVYLITRAAYLHDLAEYGTAELVTQSRHTRGESSPADRWGLYRLTFRADLQRLPPMRISPAEAAGLVEGPILR